MPIDGVPTGGFKNSPVTIGHVRRHVNDAANVDMRESGLPVLADPWRDRSVVRRGVVVRTVGASLPAWVEPSMDDEHVAILDIVVLHGRPAQDAHEDWRVPAIASLFRIVVSDARLLTSDEIWRHLPRADITVSADAADLDTVARCFADLMGGSGLVGIDTRDVLNVTDCRGSRTVLGRAVLIPGQGAVAGRAACDALAAMERREEVTAILLCQFIAPANSTLHDLIELDAMASAAMRGRDRPLVLTGMLDRSRTEVVVIAFSPSV